MSELPRVIFGVTVVECEDGGFYATGTSDGHPFTAQGSIDTVYHEVENQLDSATTRTEEVFPQDNA